MDEQPRICRLFVVEDDDNDYRLMLQALRELSFPVATTRAADGEEAIQIARLSDPLEDHFDLVLLDSQLPKHPGLEVLRVLRQVDPVARVPIVFFTGTYQREPADRANALGATSCLAKPVENDAFLGTVRDIVAYWYEVGRSERNAAMDEPVGLLEG
jgi:CheY-like chemotaxis protein